MPYIIIDPEFSALIPPLKQQERSDLEASLKAEGCRDALVVWAGHNILLDGHHRLELCREHGISYRTVEYEFESREAAGIWMCENQRARRNLEAYAIILLEEKRAEFDKRKARAKQATSTGGDHPQLSAMLPKGAEPINVRKIVAERSGYSERTVAKVRVIEEHIRNTGDDQIKVRLLKGEKTSINKEYKRIVEAKHMAEALAKVERAVLQPSGLYHAQIADPPWPYEKRIGDPENSAKAPYPSMSLDEILAYLKEKVVPFFHPDAILWLWTTNAFLHEAFHLLEAAGLKYITTMTWFKNRMSTGDWLRGQTEHCLFATLGHPVVTLTNQTTALLAPIAHSRHSRKPDEFYELVRALCPGRIAEHFARERREGFDCIGAELDAFDYAAGESAAASRVAGDNSAVTIVD
jgi:N6-adenosine-specific RNA methylase IME4